MRTVEEMKQAILDWEESMGEDFLDYFDSSMNYSNLLFFSLGKGYITEQQFQAWEYHKSMAIDSEVLMGEETFSIVNEEHYKGWGEAQDKAYTILAEFLSSSRTYQERVEEFLTNVREVKLEEAVKRFNSKYYSVYYEFNGERSKLHKDDVLSQEILTSARWFVEELEL